MPRTAVCIDKRMPLSAGKVAAAMLQEYPSLQGRWHFVEGKLGAVTINSKEQNQESSSSSSNTLLCGIHACGILSDQILALAVQGSAPVVLLPCCHTKKSLDEMERKDYDQNNQMVSVQQDGPKKEESNKEGSLAEFVDLQRIKRLQQAGYDVQRTYIPRQFTPQNSIILASPPLTQQKSQSPPSSRSSRYRKGSLPHGHVLIPIDDTTTAKTIVRSMAGRDAAMARKLPPSPAFCVSLAMPEDKHHHVKPKGLSALDGILSSNEKRSTKPTYGATLSTRMTIHVDYADSEAFFHASSARYFRTFRIEYGIDAKLDRDIHKEAAMELHKEMCRQIPVEFPGCTVRS
ncbi:expressed unknown protein [Seminavis robusta]|uniref:Methyltransferase domain-containing protein n=1 Tax=Seminavis robusta TaxID=568900 RepID=A0A9N8EA47_9STRA|nr:expressed unknown protein [Seminavis robusta]|eukprot:Sro797_g203870.1 n/a (346) ;mRNA; r:22710-23747